MRSHAADACYQGVLLQRDAISLHTDGIRGRLWSSSVICGLVQRLPCILLGVHPQLGSRALDPGGQAITQVHAMTLVLFHVRLTQPGFQHAIPAAGFHYLNMPVVSCLLVGQPAVQGCSGVLVHGRWAGGVCQRCSTADCTDSVGGSHSRTITSGSSCCICQRLLPCVHIQTVTFPRSVSPYNCEGLIYTVER